MADNTTPIRMHSQSVKCSQVTSIVSIFSTCPCRLHSQKCVIQKLSRMMQDCGSMSIHTNKNLLALYKIEKKNFFFALLGLFQNKMAEESE